MKRRNFIKTTSYSLGAVGLCNLLSTKGFAAVTSECPMWTGVTGNKRTMTLNYNITFNPQVTAYAVETWVAQAQAGALDETGLLDNIHKHYTDPSFSFYSNHTIPPPPPNTSPQLSLPELLTETLCASTLHDVPTVELIPIPQVTYSVQRINPTQNSAGTTLIITIESRTKLGSTTCP